MANIQVLEEGPRNLVIKVDGTGGDTAQTIVDVSALNPACTRVRLMKAKYDVSGTSGLVTLLWDATAAVPIIYMSPGPGQELCFHKEGGITNNAGVGVTGDVQLTSTASTNFSIVLWFAKGGVIDSLVD